MPIRSTPFLTPAMNPADPTPRSALVSLVERVEQEFLSRHARPPSWIAAAPGRVNLIGEHIDYNDGFVLPMAIDRYVVIAAAPRDTIAGSTNHRSASFHSVNLQESIEVDLTQSLAPRSPTWSRYVEGVLAQFLQRGAPIAPFDAVLDSSIPLGGGLSSSAALEVATATLIEAILGRPLELHDKALLCQKAEHRFAGVPCGIMDQFSSVYGQADALMLLDCQSQQIQMVPLGDNDITVLITNSNVQHELSGGEYGQRRAQCQAAKEKLGGQSWRAVTLQDLETHRDRLDATERRRARHVITEIERTRRAADEIRAGNWPAVGELMYASHRSLRDDYEVSCEELDLLVELAEDIGEAGGVLGSRMTGGGFGGCTVSLVRSAQVPAVTEMIRSRYQAETGIRPHLFESRPARGAHVIQRNSPQGEA